MLAVIVFCATSQCPIMNNSQRRTVQAFKAFGATNPLCLFKVNEPSHALCLWRMKPSKTWGYSRSCWWVISKWQPRLDATSNEDWSTKRKEAVPPYYILPAISAHLEMASQAVHAMLIWSHLAWYCCPLSRPIECEMHLEDGNMIAECFFSDTYARST